jgi:hypothetical protein
MIGSAMGAAIAGAAGPVIGILADMLASRSCSVRQRHRHRADGLDRAPRPPSQADGSSRALARARNHDIRISLALIPSGLLFGTLSVLGPLRWTSSAPAPRRSAPWLLAAGLEATTPSACA